jgi:hypothetical protein
MKISSKNTLAKLGVIFGGIFLLAGAIILTNKFYFSFKPMATRGIESCEKLSGTILKIQSGKDTVSVPVSHPYCKINMWGKAELINTFDNASLNAVKPGDLIVRVVNLQDYFKDSNPLVMEMDTEVANNPKIMQAIINSGTIGGNGTVFKLKKPTGYVSICGEVKLPNLSENNFLVTPLNNVERSYSSSSVSFCSRVLDTTNMPFLAIAYKEPQSPGMAMKLYIPPEENQGVNVPVAEFLNYHDSFLPFDKAFLTINH